MAVHNGAARACAAAALLVCTATSSAAQHQFGGKTLMGGNEVVSVLRRQAR